MVTGKSCDLLNQICLVANIWPPARRSYRHSVVVNFELATNLVQEIQNLLVGVVDSNQFRRKSKRQLDLDLWIVNPVTRTNSIELTAGKFDQKLRYPCSSNWADLWVNTALETLGCFGRKFVSARSAGNRNWIKQSSFNQHVLGG